MTHAKPCLDSGWQSSPTQGRFWSAKNGACTLEPGRPGFKFDSGSTGYKLFDLLEPQLPPMLNADANTSLRAYIIKCLPQSPAVWYLFWVVATSISRDFA